MDIKTKKLPKSEIEITIELTPEEFKKYLEEAGKELSKEVKISGFRPGKVPYDVIVNHVGKDTIHAYAVDIALPHVLTETVQKEKIEMIAQPKVEVLSKEPFQFKAVIAVYPEIKIDGYEKVKIKAEEVKIAAKDVDETIENLKKQFVTWKVSLKPVKKGDKVELDFEGFDAGGAPLEGTQSKNHPLIIGENMMVPGFEDALLGLKTGEENDFTITFPKDYHKKSFQNKNVKFHVKVNKVEQPEYPEIDEAFIEKITGKKQSVDEFRKMVEQDLEEYKKSEDRKKKESELLEKFLAVTKVDVSDMLVNEEVNHMIAEMRQDMAQKGLQFDKYLEHIKKTEEELRKELEKEALKRIKVRFGVHEIMKKENIEAKEEDIKAEMKKIGNIPRERERQAKAQITNLLRLNKLFDKFIS